MSKNKEYRLKRKSLRKDYIIQDKNLTIKTLYYRNETKRNKIDQLQKENQQLKEVIEEVREVVKALELHYQQSPTMIPSTKINKLLQILNKVK